MKPYPTSAAGRNHGRRRVTPDEVVRSIARHDVESRRAGSAVRASGIQWCQRLPQIIPKLGKGYPFDAGAQQPRASRCVIRRRTCFYEQQTLVLLIFGIAGSAGGITGWD